MSQLKTCPQCGSEYELDQRFCPKDGTTLRTQNAGGDLVGEIIADRYHVLRKLGEGGMGQVYLAEHVKMGRKSAVKVMNPGMVHDADAISRFNREASNASRINHPHVASVYDFGETPDGLIYLAMEFVEGEPLTKLIERSGGLAPPVAADIAAQAADALAAAHDMGIVHRDLKPDNIMIARNRDGSPCVKVVDFGIAKAGEGAAQKVTKTGLVVGTPEYMSPEQLAGDKLDGRSDTYSLALVTFNMLTGTLPFPAETVQEAMIMRLTDRPKTLAETRPAPWPPELQAALDRALARDAAERYPSASDFARDLTQAVARMPAITAVSDRTQQISSVPETIQRPARPTGDGARAGATREATAPPPAARGKRSGVMAAAAAGALLAIGGGAWAALGAGREANESDGRVTADTARARDAATDSSAATTQGAAGSRSLPADAGAGGPVAKASPSTGTKAGPAVVPVPDASQPGSVTPPAGESSLPDAEVRRRLAELDGLVDPVSGNEADARRAISIASSLLPRLTRAQDRAAARYAQGNAYLIVDQPENACRVFREARSEARGSGLEQAIEAYFTADSAPCQ